MFQFLTKCKINLSISFVWIFFFIPIFSINFFNVYLNYFFIFWISLYVYKNIFCFNIFSYNNIYLYINYLFIILLNRWIYVYIFIKVRYLWNSILFNLNWVYYLNLFNYKWYPLFKQWSYYGYFKSNFFKWNYTKMDEIKNFKY